MTPGEAVVRILDHVTVGDGKALIVCTRVPAVTQANVCMYFMRRMHTAIA